MPQYTLGHLDRIARIDDRCARIPGLAIAGGSYRGVGVPNCIESGEQAVSKILGEWGMDLAEDHDRGEALLLDLPERPRIELSFPAFISSFFLSFSLTFRKNRYKLSKNVKGG